MKTKILFIVAVIMIGFLVSSCSKKTLIDIKNTSDQQYEIRFDGQVFSLGRNSVVELMHLAEEFTLLDPQGRNYSYTWKSLPPPPSEYIDRRFFNNRIRLLIDRDMKIYIIKPDADNFARPAYQPSGFPLTNTTNPK